MPRKVCVRHSEAVVHALLICRMILFIIIGNACVIFFRISFFRNQARFLRIWFLRNELLVFANIGPGCAERGGRFKISATGFPAAAAGGKCPQTRKDRVPMQRLPSKRHETVHRTPLKRLTIHVHRRVSMRRLSFAGRKPPPLSGGFLGARQRRSGPRPRSRYERRSDIFRPHESGGNIFGRCRLPERSGRAECAPTQGRRQTAAKRRGAFRIRPLPRPASLRGRGAVFNGRIVFVRRDRRELRPLPQIERIRQSARDVFARRRIALRINTDRLEPKRQDAIRSSLSGSPYRIRPVSSGREATARPVSGFLSGSKTSRSSFGRPPMPTDT